MVKIKKAFLPLVCFSAFFFKPPAPFDQGDPERLGYIQIDLFEPTQIGGGGRGGGGQN